MARHQSGRVQARSLQHISVRNKHTDLRHLIISIIVLIAVVYIIGTQSRSVSDGLAALRQADGAAALAAVGVFAASYIVAAYCYIALALRPISFARTIRVQLATGLTGRILPAGLGNIGMYAAYLRKQGHSLAEATAVAASNNLLGILGNVFLLVIVVIIRPGLVQQFTVPRITPTLFVIVVGCAALLLGLTIFLRRQRSGKAGYYIRNTLRSLHAGLRPSRRTVVGLLCNMLLTSLVVTVLCISVSAVGGSLAWPVGLIVLSLGMLVGAAVPTPGGLGGVEAGLLAGLVSYGINLESGLAAVLLYRGITYWLPIVPGLLVFRSIQKRYL